MFSAAGQLLNFFVKLFLGLFAVIFTVSLLVAALIVVALSLLASFITGRKPAPAAVFGRFQRFSLQDSRRPRGPPRKVPVSSSAGAAEIVDVEARDSSRNQR